MFDFFNLFAMKIAKVIIKTAIIGPIQPASEEAVSTLLPANTRETGSRKYIAIIMIDFIFLIFFLVFF